MGSLATLFVGSWLFSFIPHFPSFSLSFCLLAPLLLRLFIDGDRTKAPDVKEHLLFNSSLADEFKVQVVPYKSILTELKAICTGLSPKDKVWISDKASYAVSEAIPKVGVICSQSWIHPSNYATVLGYSPHPMVPVGTEPPCLFPPALQLSVSLENTVRSEC